MEIKHKSIILRDYRESDIDDELRWFSTDTDWAEADTPWEALAPIDEEKFRPQMLEMIKNTPENARRWRFEIESEGKHIGFVSSYYVDEFFEFLPFEDVPDSVQVYRAVSIEICESGYRNRGLGTQALEAFIWYYLSHGEWAFCLETHSENLPMIKCSEKLAFREVKRIPNKYEINGKSYDILGFRLNYKKFMAETAKPASLTIPK